MFITFAHNHPYINRVQWYALGHEDSVTSFTRDNGDISLRLHNAQACHELITVLSEITEDSKVSGNGNVQVSITLGTVKGNCGSGKGEKWNDSVINTAKTALLCEVSKLTGGASISDHIGAWVEDSGKLVTEDSFTLTTLTTQDKVENLRVIACFYKGYLWQDSVCFTVSPISSVQFL